MTVLLRNAQITDLDAIHHLALESGIGITTLSKHKAILKTKLALSVDSFEKSLATQPHDEYYLFVLEDTKTHQVVGTSAIKASLGHHVPFYAYKRIHRTRISHELNISREEDWLIVDNDFQDKSEVCTLYLKPEYRHSHHGRFLSRARFLFMAQYPKRFQSQVIAEMRGMTDEAGDSPFWNAVGQHFFKMSFKKADELTVSTNKQFIADLMPEYPIAVQLLDKQAQAVIGNPHPATKPAMHILLNEGFRYENNIDIFDAGPLLLAVCEDIKTIRFSRTASVIDIHTTLKAPYYIMANTQLNFRSIIGPLICNPSGVMIQQQTAELLQLSRGDEIRFVPLLLKDAR